MGFVSGFTGGFTLTLSIAYLSALAHHRNREQQGRALRAQALDLRTIVDPIPLPLPPTRSEAAAEQRAARIEMIKDRWNDEVARAARWVQNTDWDEASEKIQAQAGALWSRVVGDTAPVAVQQSAEHFADAARGAVQRARTEVRSVEEAAQNKALEARLLARKKTDELVGSAKEAAATAKKSVAGVVDPAPAAAQQSGGGFLSSWFGRGKDKAAELTSKAKEVVGLTSGAVGAADGIGLTTGSSAVEKALQQRYEKTGVKDARTVEEVLKERYMPIDKRDNSNLRGL